MLDISKAQLSLHKLFSEGKKQHCEPKSVIIHSNQIIDSTYFILDGYVKVHSHDSKGNERIHFLYGPGDFFPVTSLTSTLPSHIEFSAFTKVTIMQRTIQDMHKGFEDNPYSLLAIMYQQTSAYDRIINLNMGSAQQRVAHRVLTLCFRFGNKSGDHYLIDIPITLHDLANMVRLTREHTGTVVAELERKGCLVMGRRSIIVYDEQLKKYAEY
jgi:CRP-like cAMP-binding protein